MSFRVVATAKIVPGKTRNRVKRVRSRSDRKQMRTMDGELGEMSRLVKTKWDRDPDMPSKKGKEPCVTICISLPSQMFTNLYLFARKMRMNHSHLLRTALAEMMERNGWELTRYMEGSSNDGTSP